MRTRAAGRRAAAVRVTLPVPVVRAVAERDADAVPDRRVAEAGALA
ncbi:hypothetical protein [Nocardioides marinquilinus]